MPEMAHPDSPPQNPSVHHEPSDANLRWILIVGTVFLVLGAIIHTVVFWLFTNYQDYEAKAKKSTFPLAADQADTLPPAPRLEPLDRAERIQTSNARRLRAGDEAVLNSYGTTPEKGFVRIPIDRAMKLLENKLPSRKGRAGGDKKGDRLAEGGQSNSGRRYRRKP